MMTIESKADDERGESEAAMREERAKPLTTRDIR